MRRKYLPGAAFAAAALFSVDAAAQDAAIPDIAQALLDAAYETRDADEIAAVKRAVAQVFPDYADAIEADAKQQIAALAPTDTAASAEAESSPSQPDDAPKGLFAIRPWKGKIQAGASLASGNSDNLSIGLLLDAAREAGDFTHNVTGFFDIAESDNGGTGQRTLTQKRWGAAYQLDYNFTPRSYAYGRISYEEDEFSGFDYRLFAGAGLGHFFYKTEPFTWKIEGGPGFRYSPIDDTTEIDQEFAVYGATEVDWIIREGVTFEQDVNSTWTSSTTTVQSVTALTTSLMEGLATTLAFEFRYETDPPVGRENADKIVRASLVYGF